MGRQYVLVWQRKESTKTGTGLLELPLEPTSWHVLRVKEHSQYAYMCSQSGKSSLMVSDKIHLSSPHHSYTEWWFLNIVLSLFQYHVDIGDDSVWNAGDNNSDSSLALAWHPCTVAELAARGMALKSTSTISSKNEAHCPLGQLKLLSWKPVREDSLCFSLTSVQNVFQGSFSTSRPSSASFPVFWSDFSFLRVKGLFNVSSHLFHNSVLCLAVSVSVWFTSS